MNNEICTINIGDGWLDDEYTFFDDSSIKHTYDQHPTKPFITEWVEESQISIHRKDKILQKCPDEFKFQVKSILCKE